MPSFVAGSFAVAGVLAAAAPLVIHLLNRRRRRVVPWAAMDLLREALVRNRRILQLRDLALLALRTLCVLLFALALARPIFSSRAATDDPNQPVHAVLLVDNSLSMGYQRLSGTLLDEAKSRLGEYLERLPPGSRISVVPLCGSSQAYTSDVYRTTSDAREALDRIEVVDRTASFTAAVDRAREACALAPELPAKRVILIGDQQRLNWPSGAIDESLRSFPDLQVAAIAADGPRANAWVEDFRLSDDIAGTDSPAVFTATIRYDGPAARTDVEAALAIDGARVAAQTIDLEPGQSREVRFSHIFDIPAEPGEPSFVAASLSISPDNLPADDVRHLAVPVVASLPVMFVDQLGAAGEDPQGNRYGQTFHLRRLLSPISSRTGSNRQLIGIRHATLDQLERQYLEDCRLVVVAGIENPQGSVALLREYVEQGGALVIAAGGDFDPVAWTNAAWLEGAGILPLPLKDDAVGRMADEAVGRLEPFFLSPETMTDDRWRLEDASREEFDDLVRTPVFFKAVFAQTGADVLEALRQSDARRVIEAREGALAASDKRGADAPVPATGTAADSNDRPDEALAKRGTDDRSTGEGLNWLLWGKDVVAAADEPAEAIAQRQEPRVLASFSNGAPFVIERQIGRGEVLFVSTGVLSDWNNMTRTNAVVLFDRLLRGMLARTLSKRNFKTDERAVLPVAAGDRRARFTLERPAGKSESIFVDAVGLDRYAIALPPLTQRGIYRVTADRAAESANSADRASRNAGRLWQVDLAVNGPADESDLKTIAFEDLRDRLADASVRWVDPGEPIRLEGAAVRGQESWKWLMSAALACLILELAILATGQARIRRWDKP